MRRAALPSASHRVYRTHGNRHPGSFEMVHRRTSSPCRSVSPHISQTLFISCNRIRGRQIVQILRKLIENMSNKNKPSGTLNLETFILSIYALYPVGSTVTSVGAEGVGMAEDLLNSPIRVAARPSNAPP